MRQMELFKKPPTQRALLTLAWIGVLVTAAFLRFDDLTKRPMHADEATGALFMAKRMEGQGGQFNPKHYHGPLLADLTMPFCKLRGESTWSDLTKGTLRVVTATAGLLLVLVPLLWRCKLGDVAALAAAALLTTSPLLVYFSRMFIHESLLVLCGALLMGLCMAFPRWGIPGVVLGLMFAAKESFAISVIAWGSAIGLLLIFERRHLSILAIQYWYKKYGKEVTLSMLTAALTALICYTHGFTHLQGAIDAVKTYFVYNTTEGHDKPWDYYLKLLALPQKSANIWWYGTPVALLAFFTYAMSWTRAVSVVQRRWIQLLAHAAVFHLLIYSTISYKTPWLACLPWALICWLAGLAFVNIGKRARWMRVVLPLFMATALWTQWKQARIANVRLHSDTRNPYAYVPSRSSVETMTIWLGKLEKMEGDLGPMVVVGRGLWPLPWYLKSFKGVQYKADVPEQVAACHVVIAMPEHTDALGVILEDSHYALPYGLRDGMLMTMFLHDEIYERWINSP